MKLFFFFGDSVTLGVCDPAAGGWPARFAGELLTSGLASLPDTFHNLGVRKNSSAMVAARWEGECRTRSMEGVVNKLLFMFGTVDMAAPKGHPNIPEDQSIANMLDILELAAKAGDVLMVSAPPVADEAHDKRLAALAQVQAAACDDADIPFFDLHAALAARGYRSLLVDSVHPGPEGNALIASVLAEAPEVQAWAK